MAPTRPRYSIEVPALAHEAARRARPEERIGLLGRYGASSLIYYSRHNVQWLLDDDAAVAFLSDPANTVAVMPASDFARVGPHLTSSIRVWSPRPKSSTSGGLG
jgi:hypothetical protein